MAKVTQSKRVYSKTKARTTTSTRKRRKKK